MYLYIDDERESPNYHWKVIRTYLEAIAFIKAHSFEIKFISLDHDLGEREGKDGAAIAKYLVDLALEGKLREDIILQCHSQNPIGKKNILGYFKDVHHILDTEHRDVDTD